MKSLSHKSSVDENHSVNNHYDDDSVKKILDPYNTWMKRNVDFQALRATQTQSLTRPSVNNIQNHKTEMKPKDDFNTASGEESKLSLASQAKEREVPLNGQTAFSLANQSERRTNYIDQTRKRGERAVPISGRSGHNEEHTQIVLP